MRKSQAKKATPRYAKRASTKGDATLMEFEAKDLGDDLREAGTAAVMRPQKQTSMLIGEDLIQKLKEKAAKRGIPYQTMMKLIVREHIDEY